MRIQLTLAAFILCALGGPASAEEDWYGHHVLAADGLSSLVAVSGAIADAPTAVYIGFGGMVLGGPIVHAAHGNYGRMGISLAMRAGLITGGFLLAGLGSDDPPKGSDITAASNPFGEAPAGAFVGYLIASVIDIAFVAHEDDDGTAARMFSIGGRF